MTDDNVTVILGFRDWHLDHLDRCLASIRRQTDASIYVVDLGSRLDVLKEVYRSVETYDAHVYVCAAPEWSRSLALNLGAGRCRSVKWFMFTGSVKWFVFTDADMIFPTTWFPAVRAELAAGWGGLLLTPSRDLPPEWETLDGFDWRDDRALERMTTAHPETGQGAAMVVPREWFERVGGFDEYYAVWGGEDADLHDRAEWAGLRAKWLEGTFVGHQHHDRNWPTAEQRARVAANRIYYAERKAAGGPIVRNREASSMEGAQS